MTDVKISVLSVAAGLSLLAIYAIAEIKVEQSKREECESMACPAPTRPTLTVFRAYKSLTQYNCTCSITPTTSVNNKGDR